MKKPMHDHAAIKRATATHNNKPTLTDQSQAKDTDINIIVKRFGVTGKVPGADGQAMSGDFTNLPRDLREMIDRSRDITKLRSKLPAALKGKSVEELLTLTPDQLTNILTPPANTPADTPKEEKA